MKNPVFETLNAFIFEYGFELYMAFFVFSLVLVGFILARQKPRARGWDWQRPIIVVVQVPPPPVVGQGVPPVLAQRKMLRTDDSSNA